RRGKLAERPRSAARPASLTYTLPEPSKRAGSGAAPGSAFACYRPSLPTLHAPRLLYPLEHLWSLRLLQGLHLDVAAPVGGSERRRRVEFRAAEENHIDGHIVGDHLDDPPQIRQSVVPLLPLDCVLKPGNLVANQFVYPLDGRMQIRHDAANPILNVGVAIRRLGWSTDCTWFACFRHRCALLRRTPNSAAGAAPLTVASGKPEWAAPVGC